VSELSGERIDIVPWHPDPEIFARRALAPAKVAKVISDPERHVITAIVDEDQLSLAIGRNGQNVRLASQLIGWQIDLYSSRDWMARGAETSIFGGGDEYEVADFPLSELDGMAPATLAALQAAGVNTFFDVLDMEKDDFVRIPGIDEAEAERLVGLIDELTVVEEASAAKAGENAAEATTGEEPGAADEEGAAGPAEGEAEEDDAAEDGGPDAAVEEPGPEAEVVESAEGESDADAADAAADGEAEEEDASRVNG
jgi:N utilization substance protein A